MDLVEIAESFIVPFLAALVGAGVGAWVSYRFHRVEVKLHEEAIEDQRRQLTVQKELHDEQVLEQRQQLKSQREQALRDAIVPLFEAIYEVSNKSHPKDEWQRAALRAGLEKCNVKILAIIANSTADQYELLDEQLNIVRLQLDRRSRDPHPGSDRLQTLHYYDRLSETLKGRDVLSLGERLRSLHEQIPPPDGVRV